jgi:hypothetical protein
MNTAFVDIVETVKQLSTDEKIELKGLLDNYLVEERRGHIQQNYEESVREDSDGNLRFSSNLTELEEMLDD